MQRRQLLAGIGLVALAGCSALGDDSEEIEELESEIEAKDDRISELETELEAKRTEIDELESEVQRIEELESEIESLETDLESERTERNNRLRDLYKAGRDYFWGGVGDLDKADSARTSGNYINASRVYTSAQALFTLSGFTLSNVNDYAQKQGDTAAAQIANDAAQVAFRAAAAASNYSDGARSREIGEEDAAQESFDEGDIALSDVEHAIDRGQLAEVEEFEAELDPIDPLADG